MHALITGGEGGLARVLADLLRRDGWLVEAPGRDTLDVTDRASVERVVGSGEWDLVVCAAGVTQDGPMLRTGEDAWDRVWQVNASGAWRCVRAAMPGLVARGTGHVVLVSSYSAVHPPAGQVAYAAAKAALVGLTQSLAAEVGAQGVRVNCVLPGFLDTKMTAGVSPSRKDEVLRAHALGRLNTVDRAAEFIVYLHKNLPHTSGQVFSLDSRIV